MQDNTRPCPPPWHVEPISHDDDARLRVLMASYAEQTGERVTKSGALRRVVREAVRRIADPGVDQGA